MIWEEDMKEFGKITGRAVIAIAAGVATTAGASAADFTMKFACNTFSCVFCFQVAKYRPQAPILVLTPSGVAARQCESLLRGTRAYVMGSMIGSEVSD